MESICLFFNEYNESQITGACWWRTIINLSSNFITCTCIHPTVLYLALKNRTWPFLSSPLWMMSHKCMSQKNKCCEVPPLFVFVCTCKSSLSLSRFKSFSSYFWICCCSSLTLYNPLLVHPERYYFMLQRLQFWFVFPDFRWNFKLPNQFAICCMKTSFQ